MDANNKAELFKIKAEQFKKEFKELLTKYNASIYADVDGDTHCMSVDVVVDIADVEVLRNNDAISQFDI